MGLEFTDFATDQQKKKKNETRLAELSRELNVYCDQHDLPHDCADELLVELYCEEPRREELCRWMQAFVDKWESVE